MNDEEEEILPSPAHLFIPANPPSLKKNKSSFSQMQHDKFHCECEMQIPQDEIDSHFEKCKKMRADYTLTYHAIENLLT